MRLFLAWVTALLLACRVQAAAVFAHFMVTNSANYTSSDWENDMKLAQDAHIDAFALNMAYNDPTNTKALPAAFAAADSVGFKLFFSFDYAGNGDWPMKDVVKLITQYSAHSSYFFYKGQAFVSTFEGPDRAKDWRVIKMATNCFFIPSWSSLGAKPAVETGVVDGLFSWAGWPWGDQDMNTYIDASYIQYLAGIPYMMPVSPWFFTNLPGYKKNWIWRGDHLWHDRWQEVLYVQPEFVEIISWNDYGESHYIGPLYGKAMEAFEIGQAPFNYVTDMPHDGWRATLPYWIDMYKQGSAEVTQESIIAWYRLAPAAACGSGGTSGNTASQLQIEFSPAEMAQDRIFFSAVLGSFSGAVVSIGGDAQTVGWSFVPDDDVGVYHGSVAFGGRTGPVTVSLMRENVVIATIEGKAISGSCTNGIQNWNAWVGSAKTGSAVSARTSIPLSEQKCSNGTGTYNFAGLCGFACKYGYCPLGACTCTKMGLGFKKPNSTGVVGYPIPGEDASYSGLCNFDCNLGFCPPSACGTVEVPLSTPSVSPFLPPACTAGTGAGNLAGLCDFSCTHGFCPMNACTCTGQGAVNVMNPTTDVTGEADPGQDPAVYGPLCGYACQRGYCPEGACVSHSGSSTGPGSGSGSDGGSNGTGDLYVAASVADSKSGSNIATGIAPLNIIVAPSTLDFETVFSIGPLVTPIEVAWTTTKTVTTSGQPTVTTTVTRTVQTTTFTIPEIRTNRIPWWNWNISAADVTHSSTTLFPSFALDPIVFRDSPNPQDTTNTVTAYRTLYPPPGLGPNLLCLWRFRPPLSNLLTVVPQVLPARLAVEPSANESWEDPADPDPPTSHSKCSGPDCDDDGDCTGPYCVKKGCTGTDCDTESHVCLGSDCERTGCLGSGCKSNGVCTDGTSCQTVGCYGSDCNGSGSCLGLSCISLGCIGLHCTQSTGKCTGYNCNKITCSGPNCKNGQCIGKGCTSEENDCESAEADVCTETVYSSMVTSASTYTTKTSTSCKTITACNVEASTATTTISSESAYVIVTLDPYPDYSVMNDAEATSIQKSMEDMFESIWASTSSSSPPPTIPTSVPIGGDCDFDGQCEGDCPKGKILQCANQGGGGKCTCMTDQKVPPYGTMCQSVQDCTRSYYCALGDTMVCEERDYSNGEPVCLCIKESGS
ncbi:hypothetical protein N7517_000606 [Penicillium concentricum]|uniref:Uncharacterized protein n=1 Tax=Penicillium concentricum TaxID=293559 RepID=A0A9W9SRB2_9EURO|nr:uncharacterized protein N7517_000606 [Penicillium concentricum]KAJ5382695.1 hypothetical protein N7517_000606 [Penicillium concentricum]